MHPGMYRNSWWGPAGSFEEWLLAFVCTVRKQARALHDFERRVRRLGVECFSGWYILFFHPNLTPMQIFSNWVMESEFASKACEGFETFRENSGSHSQFKIYMPVIIRRKQGCSSVSFGAMPRRAAKHFGRNAAVSLPLDRLLHSSCPTMWCCVGRTCPTCPPVRPCTSCSLRKSSIAWSSRWCLANLALMFCCPDFIWLELGAGGSECRSGCVKWHIDWWYSRLKRVNEPRKSGNHSCNTTFLQRWRDRKMTDSFAGPKQMQHLWWHELFASLRFEWD